VGAEKCHPQADRFGATCSTCQQEGRTRSVISSHAGRASRIHTVIGIANYRMGSCSLWRLYGWSDAGRLAAPTEPARATSTRLSLTFIECPEIVENARSLPTRHKGPFAELEKPGTRTGSPKTESTNGVCT
jgi:hypothetical protein